VKSDQYEELCRVFLSESFGIPLDTIRSVSIPSATRPGLPEYRHQIDLYWETGNDVVAYLHVANAKWRTSEKVDQPEVLLLKQVKQEVNAHKAVMITNTGFTAGATAVAENSGIALHVVEPSPSLELPSTSDRAEIRTALTSFAATSPNSPPYTFRVEHRAHDGPLPATQMRPPLVVRPSPTSPTLVTRVVAPQNAHNASVHAGQGPSAGGGTQNRGSAPVSKGGGTGNKR